MRAMIGSGGGLARNRRTCNMRGRISRLRSARNDKGGGWRCTRNDKGRGNTVLEAAGEGTSAPCGRAEERGPFCRLNTYSCLLLYRGRAVCGRNTVAVPAASAGRAWVPKCRRGPEPTRALLCRPKSRPRATTFFGGPMRICPVERSEASGRRRKSSRRIQSTYLSMARSFAAAQDDRIRLRAHET